LWVGLGVYRGEGRGEGVSGQNEDGVGIERSGHLFRQSSGNGQHEPVLQFYPGMLYIPLWYDRGFGDSGNI